MRQFVCVVALASSIFAMVLAGITGGWFWYSFSAGGFFQNPIFSSILFIGFFDGAIFIVGLICLVFWERIAEAMPY